MAQTITEQEAAVKVIARRWCILNAWGWPDDVSMPLSFKERREAASNLMADYVRAIGRRRCLEYWNSEEFDAEKVVPKYGHLVNGY